MNPIEIFRGTFRGRRVAVIGNANPKTDFSESVDAADIVVRLNHCPNLESGKTGKRIDVIIQVPTTAWFRLPESEQHREQIRMARPRVFLLHNAGLAHVSPLRELLAGLDVHAVSPPPQTQGWSTGGKALKMIVAAEPASLNGYCFSDTEQEFEAYLRTEGRHHLPTAMEEFRSRRDLQ
ncbi:MAG: hypothetical protein IJW39_02035 [Opitutales bacterium]|nr:hypothetical protein [Opitutales bacterium]MBQ8723706.1 hypothetical protein [Opitutales bacterium]